jgi:hypothetical protein
VLAELVDMTSPRQKRAYVLHGLETALQPVAAHEVPYWNNRLNERLTGDPKPHVSAARGEKTRSAGPRFHAQAARLKIKRWGMQ